MKLSEAYLQNMEQDVAKILVPQALMALRMDRSPANYVAGQAILTETTRLSQEAVRDDPRGALVFSTEYRSVWNEGIVELTIALSSDSGPVRLFETGFLANPQGDLVICKVQKHRLKLTYRQNRDAQSMHVMEEKREGDRYWRTLRDTSGYPPELFGFLTTALIYGPHTRNGLVVFPAAETQPEVTQRQHMVDVAKLPSSASWGFVSAGKIQEAQDQIEKIKRCADFYGMLAQMGVHAQPERPGYYCVSLEHILQGIHHAWTDDADHVRHPLRAALYTIYHMQHNTSE